MTFHLVYNLLLLQFVLGASILHLDYDAREHTHQKLKMRTSEPLILRLSDVSWTFILLIVAAIGIGAVLLQKRLRRREASNCLCQS